LAPARPLIATALCGKGIVMEKLYIRLQRPIPGVDHLKAVDPEKFADAHHWWDELAPVLDVDSVNDFYVYEGEYGKDAIKWHRASKGLEAVRAVIAYYRAGKGTLRQGLREAVIETLTAVERVLDDADMHEIRFCFVGDY
jgi:hypothetical protein